MVIKKKCCVLNCVVKKFVKRRENSFRENHTTKLNGNSRSCAACCCTDSNRKGTFSMSGMGTDLMNGLYGYKAEVLCSEFFNEDVCGKKRRQF